MYRRPEKLPLILTASLLALASGCGGGAPPVPGSAIEVRRGPGILAYIAPDIGEVFLANERTNQTVAHAKVRGGQHVLVDPTRDLIEVADKRIKHPVALGARQGYVLYFDRSG